MACSTRTSFLDEAASETVDMGVDAAKARDFTGHGGHSLLNDIEAVLGGSQTEVATTGNWRVQGISTDTVVPASCPTANRYLKDATKLERAWEMSGAILGSSDSRVGPASMYQTASDETASEPEGALGVLMSTSTRGTGAGTTRRRRVQRETPARKVRARATR